MKFEDLFTIAFRAPLRGDLERVDPRLFRLSCDGLFAFAPAKDDGPPLFHLGAWARSDSWAQRALTRPSEDADFTVTQYPLPVSAALPPDLRMTPALAWAKANFSGTRQLATYGSDSTFRYSQIDVSLRVSLLYGSRQTEGDFFPDAITVRPGLPPD